MATTIVSAITVLGCPLVREQWHKTRQKHSVRHAHESGNPEFANPNGFSECRVLRKTSEDILNRAENGNTA